MYVSMEPEQEQVNPPVPPSPGEARSPHQADDDAADGNILAELNYDDSEGEDVFLDPDATRAENDEGGRSTNVEATTGLPQPVFEGLAKISPDDGSFDWSTKAFKRRKLMSLQFDEKGKMCLLAWCLVRITSITCNTTRTHHLLPHIRQRGLGVPYQCEPAVIAWFSSRPRGICCAQLRRPGTTSQHVHMNRTKDHHNDTTR